MKMSGKWTSRKFWISVAAFLASIATSISGMATSDRIVTIIGIVCGVLSAAIYAAAEARVDSANVGTSTIQKIITATTDSKEVVQATLAEATVQPVVIETSEQKEE